MRRHVAILLFDEVEVLDFAGPFEVFAVTDELHHHTVFNTFTIAEKPGTVRTVNGRILTAAGISAGIDCTLHVVGRLLDAASVEQTMRYMEYGRFAQPA